MDQYWKSMNSYDSLVCLFHYINTISSWLIILLQYIKVQVWKDPDLYFYMLPKQIFFERMLYCYSSQQFSWNYKPEFIGNIS